MKQTYRITLLNSLNQMVAYRVLATSLAQAISAAQVKGGAAVDPQTTQNEGAIDIDATVPLPV